MLIGIDVGGTFTDGVVFADGKILKSVKQPTDAENIKSSLLMVLDDLIKDIDQAKIARIVISTTLVTNLLATNRGERTALILFAGYGLPHSSYTISPDTYFIRGSIDFRGREIEPPDQNEIIKVIEKIREQGIKRIAVAGKFSNRNDKHEKLVKTLVEERFPELSVSISSQISGKLNFPRRATTTYYTAMTISDWNRFADEIETAVKERNLSSELHILKADGGTMPLAISRFNPCETIFSGPAASTMGAVAVSLDDYNSVVLDIGGTTTDISLIIEGQPLYASRGAHIGNRFTQVNAFAVRSIPLGGDSTVSYYGEVIEVAASRKGPAACFGGNLPTVTDAFNHAFNLGIGQYQQSAQALQVLAEKAQMAVEAFSSRVVDLVLERLSQSIESMFKEWESEPEYKVWEVINRRKFRLDRVIGIGAAAGAIIPRLAERMRVKGLVHQYSPVANALGASVVRPTLSVNLHVDTQSKTFAVDPGGIKGQLRDIRNFQIENARKLALQYLEEIGQQRGMAEYAGEYSFFMEEQFNMIRGWDRTGKLFDLGVQVAPGFIPEFKGVIV